MAKSDFCCYAYDFHINDFHQVMIHTYYVGIENKYEGNKRRSSYVFKPYEEQLDIQELDTLKRLGYVPYHNFGYDNDVTVCNKKPLLDIKLKLLTIRNKILERIYDIVIIDGKSYIFTYITYVNVNSGEHFMLNMGKFDLYAEDKIANLEQLGYVDVFNSSLFAHIDYIDIHQNKTLSLNRILVKNEE